MAEEAKYNYSKELQQKILALIVRDNSFLMQYQHLLKPTYFDFPLMQVIARTVLTAYASYGIVPTVSVMKQILTDNMIATGADNALIQNTIALYDELCVEDISDYAAVTEKAVEFGRMQAVKASIFQAVDYIKNGNLDEAESALQRSASFGLNVEGTGLGLNHAHNIQDIVGIMHEEEKTRNVVSVPINTHFPSLHNYFGQHGMKGGQVFALMGYPGTGKSTFLRSLGVCAIQYNYPVVHYTICDIPANEVGLLYACALTDVPIARVIEGDQQFKQRAAALASRNYYLRIKEFRPYSQTVNAIRSHLMEIQVTDGITPALVLVDYPDKLKKSNPDESKYENEAYNIDQLYSIAQQFGCVVWWAWQPTKSAAETKKRVNQNDVLTMEDGAGAFGKTHTCDGVFSLNMNNDEMKNRRARLWCDKARRFKRPPDVIPLTTFYDRGSLREWKPGDA